MLTAITLLFSTQLAGCLPVTGDVIRAADLAPAAPVFSTVPADTRIGYAPAPGATRRFKVTDLEREARHLDIELGEANDVCFQWPLSVPSEERFLEAMTNALDLPGAKIEIEETSRHPAPPGRLVFSRSSLRAPAPGHDVPVTWRGQVEYGDNGRFQVWARVRISAAVDRVVTTEPIRAGEPIAPQQVRLERVDGFPFGDRAADSLDEVVGQILRVPLTGGVAVPAHLLDRPLDVERTDVVQVRVRNGPAVILAEGEAQAGGRRGDTIPVRNPTSGATFNAKITGPKQVTLTLSGR
jgi:flagella basal body P-ring formation protein FlgA